jgi:hypothetical protein
MSFAQDPGAITSQCPNCKAALPANAVICVACGLHLKEGKMLKTTVESSSGPASAISLQQRGNPYRAPTTGDTYAVGGPTNSVRAPSSDWSPRLESLEHRIRELERRIDGTRLVAPGFFTRMWAVFGYMMMANLILFMIYIFFGIILIFIVTLLNR